MPLFALVVMALLPQKNPGTSWSQQHDQLVARLRAVEGKGNSFGPAYSPVYKAILPWYEAWGGRNQTAVDTWMVSPEIYADELATALEQGHNYVAEHMGSTFPAWFEKKLPDGKTVRANYLLHLPVGFAQSSRRFPLSISLPGSGWIGHKISYSRGGENTDLVMSATPILEGNRWELPFLNAYLDELIKTLPVDADRVYVGGHSLGAMATWSWAMANPERFAAINPEDGVGEPYRAVRLKYVPVWVIHGEKDQTFPPYLAEEMVSAVRATGGTALYSQLKDAPHNVPEWFNGTPVLDWLLAHSRSRHAAPPDPRSLLRLDKAGFSPYTVVSEPRTMYWQSPETGNRRAQEQSLYGKIQARGVIADSQTWQVVDPATGAQELRLEVPLEMQTSSKLDPSMAPVPARTMVSFYFVGTPEVAAKHLKEQPPQLTAGETLSTELWIKSLGRVSDSGRQSVSLCRCEVLSAK